MLNAMDIEPSSVVANTHAGDPSRPVVNRVCVIRPLTTAGIEGRAGSPLSVPRGVGGFRAPVVVVHTPIGGLVIVNEDGEVLGVRVR